MMCKSIEAILRAHSSLEYFKPKPIPHIAFPEIYWAFTVTGRSPGLAAAAAPGRGQVALGAKKVALGPSGPPRGPRHCHEDAR